ncbi:MAG TPA: VCBS repeat-containing protein, partial [Kofleriaceae bacterium]|nr:VCBS repeat-containing protein [Kofleriaceae bacterium]
MLRHACPLLVLVACTDAATIQPGTCGNYVLEPGEDCDQPGSACTSACRIACDPTMRGSACASPTAIDGSCCPGGFTCGVDRTCHAPSGKLSTADIAAPFDVSEFRVADVDGDQIDDLLGVSSSAVTLLYGATDTPLAQGASAIAPFATGAPTLGDLDGDGRPDVVIPSTGGIAAYQTTTGTIEPVAFPTAAVPYVEHLRLAALDPTSLVQLDLITQNGSGGNLELSLDGNPPVPLCGTASGSAALHGRALHPYKDGTAVRVPVMLASGAGIAVCVQNAAVASDYILLATSFSGDEADSDGEVFAATVTGASCPDLFVPFIAKTDGTEQTLLLPGTGSAGSCTFGTDPEGSDLPTSVFHMSGISLASAHVYIPTATPSVITSAGIFTVATNPLTHKRTATLVTPPTRSWRFALVADLDGNGADDIVTLGTAQDVEVLIQLIASPTGVPQWNDFRIPTAEAAELATTGDFDGDGVVDVAIATADPADPRAAELGVAWGGSEGYATLQPVGRFGEFDQVVTQDLVDTSVPPGFDHSEDLVVAHGGDDPTDPSDPAELVDVFGAADRDLGAPFDFESTFGNGSNQTRGAGAAVLIGKFGAGGALGALALFQSSPTGKIQTSQNNAALIDLTYQPYDSFTFDSARETDFQTCKTVGNPNTFCALDARYVTVSLGGGDLALGFRSDALPTGETSCIAYYQAAAGAPSFGYLPCSDDVKAAQSNVSFARVIENGTPDVAVVLGHGSNQAKASFAAQVFGVTMAGTTPSLGGEIDLSAEINGFLYPGAAPSDPAACMD